MCRAHMLLAGLVAMPGKRGPGGLQYDMLIVTSQGGYMFQSGSAGMVALDMLRSIKTGKFGQAHGTTNRMRTYSTQLKRQSVFTVLDMRVGARTWQAGSL